MKNLITWIIDSVKENENKVLIINKDVKHTYRDFFNDALKVVASLKPGRILLKANDKYHYVLGFIASLLTHNLVFLSSENSHVYDNYSFNQIIDDDFVIEALNNKPRENIITDFNDLDPACVILSSGTSLTPKPIVLSYQGMRRNIESGLEILQPGKDWTFLSFLPLDHAFGITSDFLDLLFSGATIVFTYTVMEYFINLRKYEPQMLCIPLNLLLAIKDMLEKQGRVVIGHNLQQVLVGGSKCTDDVVEYFKQYDVMICPSYGLTECSPCVSLSSRQAYKKGSDGKILSCHQVSISDEGEIIIKGDSLMLNYLEDFDKGIIVDEVHTKDRGHIEDGYLFVEGRLDNLLILDNGFKIQPESFEKEIKNIPGVKECIIYLNNHKLYLDVQVEEGFNFDLRKHLNNLDITINYVDSFVTTSLGKINRGYYKNKKE